MREVEKISLVIFDMDGLMLDTERVDLVAWAQAGKELGIPVAEELILRTIGLGSNETAQVFYAKYGKEYPYHELRRRRIDFAMDMLEKEGAPLKPGLLTLLTYLDKKGIKKAVGTSTERRRALRCLELAGLDKRFDWIVCGSDVPHAKPEPDIFLRIAELAQVPPVECIVLEDSINGVMAAHRAGMHPIMVPDLVQPPKELEQIISRKFESLHGAEEYLSRKLG